MSWSSCFFILFLRRTLWKFFFLDRPQFFLLFLARFLSYFPLSFPYFLLLSRHCFSRVKCSVIFPFNVFSSFYFPKYHRVPFLQSSSPSYFPYVIFFFFLSFLNIPRCFSFPGKFSVIFSLRHFPLSLLS